MIDIRPVSDLRNKFSEIETIVSTGKPVYLTKNGYGSMVVMSIEHYEQITNSIEYKLEEALQQATQSDTRISHEEMMERLKQYINKTR